MNQAGIDHYHKVIDAVIARNITPVVTIFHWDMPQWLQDIGGVTNPIFVDYFVAYADVVFKEYGSKVSTTDSFYKLRLFDSPFAGQEIYYCQRALQLLHHFLWFW